MNYCDILLTVDFDRTLTGPDSKIPPRNLEAIEYFMAQGGTFTVNTGRSTGTFWKYLDTIPRNAPLLLYNGSAAYDASELTQLRPIDLDVWQTLGTVKEQFPGLNLEIQGIKCHYLIDPSEKFLALYDKLQWRYEIAQWGQEVGPFIKFALFGEPQAPAVSSLYEEHQGEIAMFDAVEQKLRQLFGEQVAVFRAAPRIIDVHAKGVSKLQAARDLQKALGKHCLVCVGDAENDLPMLEGADFAYCPADGVVADRFENVCPCGDGAIADVIYEKIPALLGKSK